MKGREGSMRDRGSYHIAGVLFVLIVAAVLLVLYFGSGLGPGIGGPGGKPPVTDPDAPTVPAPADAEQESGFVIQIRGATYYRAGQELSLDDAVGEAKAWAAENPGAVRITQADDDKAQSGAVSDLVRALRSEGIACSEDL